MLELILICTNIYCISLLNLSSFKCWTKDSEAILLENGRHLISHNTVNGLIDDSIIILCKTIALRETRRLVCGKWLRLSMLDLSSSGDKKLHLLQILLFLYDWSTKRRDNFYVKLQFFYFKYLLMFKILSIFRNLFKTKNILLTQNSNKN